MELFILTRTVDYEADVFGAKHLETHGSIAAAGAALHEYINEDGITDAVQVCIDNDWDRWYDFMETRWEEIDGISELVMVRLGMVTYQITKVEIDV